MVLGIGSFSHHAVSGSSSQALSGTMAELFIPFLQQEGEDTVFFVLDPGTLNSSQSRILVQSIFSRR